MNLLVCQELACQWQIGDDKNDEDDDEDEEDADSRLLLIAIVNHRACGAAQYQALS